MNYDVTVIGNGPAGCSAAIYAKRAGVNVGIVSLNDSALLRTKVIENYYPLGAMSGEKIYQMGIDQLKGLSIPMINAQVTHISFGNDAPYEISTTDGVIKTKSIIIACGKGKNEPSIKGLKDFEGRGVSYCAVCDGFFFKNRTIGVIGEGDYAFEEAKYLLGVSDRVTVYTNGAEPENIPNGIAVNTLKISEITGSAKIEKIVFDDGTFVPVDGVFVAVGTASGADFTRNLGLQVFDGKFTVDDKLQTNIPGIFAAGDCIGGLDQIATAVSDGAKAGLNAAAFIKALK